MTLLPRNEALTSVSLGVLSRCWQSVQMGHEFFSSANPALNLIVAKVNIMSAGILSLQQAHVCMRELSRVEMLSREPLYV